MRNHRNDYARLESDVDQYAGDTGLPAVILSYGAEDDERGDCVALYGETAIAYLDHSELAPILTAFDWVELAYTNDPRTLELESELVSLASLPPTELAALIRMRDEQAEGSR